MAKRGNQSGRWGKNSFIAFNDVINTAQSYQVSKLRFTFHSLLSTQTMTICYSYSSNNAFCLHMMLALFSFFKIKQVTYFAPQESSTSC